MSVCPFVRWHVEVDDTRWQDMYMLSLRGGIADVYACPQMGKVTKLQLIYVERVKCEKRCPSVLRKMSTYFMNTKQTCMHVYAIIKQIYRSFMRKHHSSYYVCSIRARLWCGFAHLCILWCLNLKLIASIHACHAHVIRLFTQRPLNKVLCIHM